MIIYNNETKAGGGSILSGLESLGLGNSENTQSMEQGGMITPGAINDPNPSLQNGGALLSILGMGRLQDSADIMKTDIHKKS